MKARVQKLIGENSKLPGQIKELTLTASAGTNGLTILSRNLKTQDETQMVDYVVRNDTHQTLDEISLDFQYLDKDGTQWNVTWSYGHVMPTGKTAPPVAIRQGIKTEGKVVFDLPSTDESFVFNDGYGSGCDWEYPLSTDPAA